MDIRWQVERFMKERAVAPTQMGRWAVGDPRLVFDMRRGRQVGPRIEARLRAFMTNYCPRPQGLRGRPRL